MVEQNQRRSFYLLFIISSRIFFVKIVVIKNFLYKKPDNFSKENFQKFENLYNKLLEEFMVKINFFRFEFSINIKKNDINVNDLKILYGSLFRTIKKMKRDIENNIKFDKTDPHAYMEKLKVENKSFIPVALNLGKNEKITTFGILILEILI